MSEIAAILTFGGVALLTLAGLQGAKFKVNPNSGFTVSFTKSFGLIVVAILGVVLVFAGDSVENADGAYALLGIIAGYLAGAKGSLSDEGAKDKPKASKVKGLPGSTTEPPSKVH